MKPNICLSTTKRCQINSIYQSGFSNCCQLLQFQNSLIYPAGNNIILDQIEGNSKQITFQGHDNFVTVLAIHQGKGYLATGQVGSPGSKNYDSPVFLWNLQQNKKIAVFQGLKQGVKSLAFSSDCKYLVGVSHKNQFIIWDLQNYNQIFARILENPISILNFETDIINIVNGKMLQQVSLQPLLKSNKPPIFNNFTLPSSGFPRKYTQLVKSQERVYLIGTESGEVCLFVKGVFKYAQIVGQGKVNSLTMHHNGTGLYVAIGRSILHYQFKSQKLIIKQKIQCQQVKKLHLSGQLLLGLTQSGILSFNKANLSFRQLRYSHSSRINGVACKNQIIVSIQSNGYIYSRQHKNSQTQLFGIYTPSKKIQGICVDVDYSGNIIAGYADGSVHSVSLDGRKLFWEISAHKGKVTSISANDMCFLTGGEDSVVRIWQQKTHQMINQLSVHQKAISRTLVDHKYSHVIHSCSQDRSFYAYDMKADKKIYFKQISNGTVTDMDQVRSSGDIGICGPGYGVSFWHENQHKPYLQLQAQTKIMKLALNRSGVLLALGDSIGNILLYDLEHQNYMGAFEGHSREITGITWVDQRSFVTVSDDRILAIWEV